MFFSRKPESEADLVEGCKLGKPKAQEMLYKHYYGYAMTICLQYAKHEDEAAEMLNDSFFKVFMQIEKYDKNFDFKHWLRRIVVNTAVDACRKKESLKKLYQVQDLNTIDEPLQDDETAQLTAEEIIYFLKQLPDNHRIVFNLYEIEGYGHEEIAEKLGISEAVSRTFLSRAKQKLKQIVNKEFAMKM